MKRKDGLDRYIEKREKEHPGFKAIVEAARARILCAHEWGYLSHERHSGLGFVDCFKCRKCGRERSGR